MYNTNKKMLKNLFLALLVSILLVIVTNSDFFLYVGTILLTALIFSLLLLPLTKALSLKKYIRLSKIGVVCNIFSFISISIFSVFTEISINEFVNILFTIPLFLSIALSHVYLILLMKESNKIEKILRRSTFILLVIVYIMLFLMVTTIISYDLIYYVEIQILIMLAIIFTLVCLLDLLIRKLLTLILN